MDNLAKQEETRVLNMEENFRLINLWKSIEEIFRREEIMWKQRVGVNG